MLALDELIKSETEKPLVSGQFFQIQATPDIVTQERFNIGVALDVDGQLYCKMMDNFERIRCLYGESYINTFKLFVEAAELSVQDNAFAASKHLHFSERSTFKGESVEEILNYLFEDTVPLNRPTQKQMVEKKEAGTRLKQLIDYLRDFAKTNYSGNASEFFPDYSDVLVKHGNYTVPINIPIRSDRKLGTVILANQRSAQSVETNLNRGATNIHIAKNTDKHNKECGVIVLSSNFEEAPDIAIQSKLDRFYLDMDSSDISIISHTEKEALAEYTLDWATGYN